jgi:hypothetical protein
MHTVKIIALGFGLLAVCLFLGHAMDPKTGFSFGAKVFLALWLFGAGFNMWYGVRRAGYSVREEAPVFLVVYGIPAGTALLVWWFGERP